MYLIYVVSENVYSDVNEKRNLDICISLSSNFQIVNQFFFLQKYLHFCLLYILVNLYIIFFHASRMIVSIMYLCKQRIWFFFFL